MTEQQIKEELRQRVAANTLAYVAGQMGVSISYLHDVVRSRRKPGRKILKALGLQKKVEFVRT